MTKSRGILGARYVWSPEAIAMLRRDYANKPAQEIADVLGIELFKVYAKAVKLRLKKSEAFLASERSGRITPANDIGAATRFQKGWPSPRRGKPFPTRGRMGTTQFKKGHSPHNSRFQIGDRRINSLGYLDRKISTDRHGGLNWEAEHRLVWKAAHGAIPSGHVVTFKPGRHSTVLRDVTLDALELITNEEHLRRHSLHRLPKDLVRVIQLKGAITRQINKRARHEKQD